MEKILSGLIVCVLFALAGYHITAALSDAEWLKWIMAGTGFAIAADLLFYGSIYLAAVNLDPEEE